MFSPDLHHLPMYQLQTDHLPPLPSLIIATNQDLQSTLTYEPNHQYLHDQQYELLNSSIICESPPSSYYAVLADEPNKSIISGGLTQRSVSSHSLPPQMNDNNNSRRNMAFNYKPASNAINLGRTHRLLGLIDSSSVRRVLSTGDLQMQQYQVSQQQHGLSSPKEGSSSSIIEGMLSQACRYSPKEKRERIERYKTKRSHRNFNKKIKYACRKTLADSRPRIKGRFARNNNNEDESLDDKWGGNREDETGDQRENNEDNKFDLLFNAAWLLE